MNAITVIMLTYNRKDFVARAVDSILTQTYKDFQFVIVDNGSTDRSGDICDGYMGIDSRVEVVHIPPSSIGVGRNVGLRLAKGEYITFVDDDDFAEPGYLDYLLALAKERDTDISVCGSWLEIGGEKYPKYVFDDIYQYNGADAVCAMLMRKVFNSANPTKLFKRSLFDNLRYSETGRYDDAQFMYKIVSQAKNVVVSGKPLYTFVRHEDNNSQGIFRSDQVDEEQIRAYIPIVQERTCWLSKRFPDRYDFWKYAELSYFLSMYDRAQDRDMKKRLYELFEKDVDFFVKVQKYYSERDQELMEKYKGHFYDIFKIGGNE